MPYVSWIFHGTEMSSALLGLTEIFGIHQSNLACAHNTEFRRVFKTQTEIG